MRRSLVLAHRSFASLPHFDTLTQVLGRQHATNETWWMIEHIAGKERYDAFRFPKQQKQPQRTQPPSSSSPAAAAAVQSPPSLSPCSSSSQPPSASVSTLLSPSELSTLCSMVRARGVDRKPLQYLLGSVGFLGLDLVARAPVLIPRPETEAMVGWTLARWKHRDYRAKYQHRSVNHETNLGEIIEWNEAARETQRSHKQQQRQQGQTQTAASPAAATSSPSPSPLPPLRVLDLCSGSGNIALSLAQHLPLAVTRGGVGAGHPREVVGGVRVVGVDFNPLAVALAEDNLRALRSRGLCTSNTAGAGAPGGEVSCTFAQVDLLQKQPQEDDDDPALSSLVRMVAQQQKQQQVQDPLMHSLLHPPACVAELLRLAGPAAAASSSSPSRLLLSSAPSGPYNLLVSNPPYIPFREHSDLQREVREWEDFAALVSGEEGMDLYDALLNMAPSLLVSSSSSSSSPSSSSSQLDTASWDVPELVLEIGSATQALQLADALEARGFNHVTIHHDLADLPRWVAAARRKHVPSRT